MPNNIDKVGFYWVADTPLEVYGAYFDGIPTTVFLER